MENHADQEAIRQSVHELRNIFCIVIGNLELLRSRADPLATKMIDRAICGAGRGDAVITTLSGLTHTQNASK
jgi:hypothetical protein